MPSNEPYSAWVVGLSPSQLHSKSFEEGWTGAVGHEKDGACVASLAEVCLIILPNCQSREDTRHGRD